MVECCGLGETRDIYRVGGGVGVEEVLLFEGRAEEKVERYTKILDDMWTVRGELIELRERTDVL